MTIIAARDLRNHTSDVLRRVSDGERITVAVRGRPSVELAPVRQARPEFFSRSELAELVLSFQSDPGLTHDLSVLAGETTDDLGPLT
ncbi:type II toxin-antitoxin system prevent-host-death family antitoxin [Propionimicrobium sp. PCR01-08-3]|uniref:type II toxin-antitoxin system Phd/YefM family antitoxin n=1 Tax=Propionimicrobium sp. PCR01-08-3 TaxID=3052086 RepID=UPI00255C3593|nr:type II toxin-antitoxin system prevent-host-death family antitoxin [Propionimicrobium sp. PCR01-08-3]WIY82176.1 type II toxin-antitoxin system prevent-host-death family antitoxin [Propionimicrobium sp. PCR01-08-3]